MLAHRLGCMVFLREPAHGITKQPIAHSSNPRGVTCHGTWALSSPDPHDFLRRRTEVGKGLLSSSNGLRSSPMTSDDLRFRPIAPPAWKWAERMVLCPFTRDRSGSGSGPTSGSGQSPAPQFRAPLMLVKQRSAPCPGTGIGIGIAIGICISISKGNPDAPSGSSSLRDDSTCPSSGPAGPARPSPAPGHPHPGIAHSRTAAAWPR
jgi:hypothetical protein